MNNRSVAHALETVKISECFLRHAKQAGEFMAEYREWKGQAFAASRDADDDLRDMCMLEADWNRRTAYSIMRPYRQEFKFRAWCRDEMTAETHISLVYGEC